MKFVRNNLPALVLAAFFTLVFFPVAALFAKFFGNIELVALFLAKSPQVLVSPEEVERSRFEADALHDLQAANIKATAGHLQLCLSPGLDVEEWQNKAVLTVDELSRLLPGKPPLPCIETRRLFNANGSMDNFFSLAVNHHGDEPLRTMSHELTHLFLLWAMIPGMPVDCPRWLNEGLAEHVSGRLAGDADGWEKFALIGSEQFLPLHVISPAFSWQGFQVEWPARTATALLLEKYGEERFRQMVDGLRYARPFHSVFPIVTGTSLDSFEREWQKKLAENYLIDRLDLAELEKRLLWLADNKGFIEVKYLLKQVPKKTLPDINKGGIFDRARIFEARQANHRGEFRRALGWLRGVFDKNEDFVRLQTEIVAEAKKTGLNKEFEEKKVSLDNKKRTSLAVLIEEIPLLPAYGLVFAFSFLVIFGSLRLRKLILPQLGTVWSGAGKMNLLFRWTVVGFTGLAGAWFIRFLIIAMIPYSGMAALSALQRIMLAELLAVFLWLGLGWQLDRWEKGGPVAAGQPGDLRSIKHLKLFLWFFFISSIPVLASIMANSRRTGAIPADQMLLAVFVLIAGGWAFSRVIWRWSAVWLADSSGVGHLGPALIYTLFRGGLAPDPWASLFALVAGYRISRLVAAQHAPGLGCIADIALTFPALILVVGWFPAVDPVAGIWSIDSAPSLWWLVPTLLLVLMPTTKEVANQVIRT